MAMSDDNLERDPMLARLLAASSRDEPPSALDAAILAAARREVHAGSQAVAGGEEASAPPVRVKRNWYIPVSIAAVLVLSVSLVRLMQEEKGDELSQPPAASRPLPKSAPAPAAEPAAASPEKADAMLRDTTPPKPKLAEEKRAAPPPAVMAPTAPEAYAESAKKQRAEKTEAMADGVTVMGGARRDQTPGAAGGMASGAPAPVQRAEPFPAAREREAPATAAAPPQPARDAMETRPRTEADRSLTRGAVTEAPLAAAPVVPEAKVLAAPRRAAPADDALTQSAPAQAERRSMAGALPPPAAKMAAPPPAKPAATPRPVVWRGLEDQPPEKWLERLAEFRRDNRQADADELLAEFRRRFPDHPAAR